MIILGLGTNLGDRVDNLRRAVRALAAGDHISVLKIGGVYESEAMLPEGEEHPDWNLPYLNTAVSIDTSLTPAELLACLKQIENSLGREEGKRWCPRVIDIDILIWDESRINTVDLVIPHPGMSKRPFALLPLLDLAPELTNRFEFGMTWRSKAADQLPFNTRRVSPLFPEWVGILNITPDSFSDGGRWSSLDSAVQQALKLVEQGASVIDIGAESTRPGSRRIGPDEEWERLESVLFSLIQVFKGKKYPARISVDTAHPQTMKRAIELGVNWINDVTGLSDPEAVKVVASADIDLVVMHSLSIPPEREKVLNPGINPVEQILEWGEERLAYLERQGISRERVIIDPGIGFGKTPKQNTLILYEAERLRDLGVRILIGHSRKSFLNLITERPFAKRDLETAVVSAALSRKGIDYLRVHDVEASKRAVAAAELVL